MNECKCCHCLFDSTELNKAKSRFPDDAIDDDFCVECITHINGYDIEDVA